MKRRIFITILTLALLVSSLSISVSAVNQDVFPPIKTADWDTVDWESINLDQYDYVHLFHWMENAQLHPFFRAINGVDGASAQFWGDIASKHIATDFSGFIVALAEEDAAMQQKIVDFITLGLYHDMHAYLEGYRFPYLVYSVKVSGSKQQQVKKLFEDAVAKYWGESRDYETYPDPDSINWDTFQYKDINISSNSAQFSYFMAIAPLNVLFRGHDHVDGAAATSWGNELSYRMKEDFPGFIAALAQEDTELQHKIVEHLGVGIYNCGDYKIDKNDFPDMVYSVKVSGDKQQYVLGLFKDEVEKYWNIPRNDDPVPNYDTLDWSTFKSNQYNIYSLFDWMGTAKLPAPQEVKEEVPV